MAETSFFFTSSAGDRKYTSADFATVFDEAFQRGEGVVQYIDGGLSVSNPGTLSVDIATGVAVKSGYLYKNSTTLNKALSAVTSGSKRYDRIVIRVDLTARQMVATIIEGVESGSPTAPAITGATDILLAKILIDRSSGSYVYTVTDERVYRAGLYSPVGMISPYGSTAAPAGWLACDGSAVSRSTYAALFAAIGTTWGVGDGSTTFNVPDLRGAFLRGAGTHGTATMADGNKFAGPAVGATENDQMHGHYHSLYTDASYTNLQGKGAAGTALSTYVVGNASADMTTMQVTAARADPSNGTPRTGDETRPFAAGVLWCIKY